MVVMGYNQQDSIGYAIDSALLQDYDGPMTIVLSDDCSSDGTCDVMRRKAEVYRGGGGGCVGYGLATKPIWVMQAIC